MITDIFGAPDGGTTSEIKNEESPGEVRIKLGKKQKAETTANACAIGAV
jgi:hypothetical protein